MISEKQAIIQRIEDIKKLDVYGELEALYDRLEGLETGGNYYDVGGIETIDFIKAKLTPEQYKGWLLGNVIKYAARVNHKGSEESDVKKLADYANRLKELNQND